VSRITARLVNDVFRSPVYGLHDIFTPESFRRFVHAYDVDLSRASTVQHNGDIAGIVAFALRGDRAWFSLIGVKPRYRRRGYGRQLLSRVVDDAIAAGARTMEFEVQRKNEIAIAMYRGIGFETIDELNIWARASRSGVRNELAPKRLTEATIASLSLGAPAACWQREPRSVARSGASAIIACEGAYAFVCVRNGRAIVLDAAARDAAAARALLPEIDRRVGCDLTLSNEPSSSALTPALHEAGWRVVRQQYRMLRREA
jgi:ribosomal protein S18 acetylase RimI-like enzyme